MPKTKVTDWDTTAAGNTEINNIGVQGTSAVQNFDNAFREKMSQIAKVNAGTDPVADTWSFADPADLTKIFRFDGNGITTATTRVITVPDSDLTLPFPGQLIGTATNDNATAGNVGEYISASVALGSAGSLTTATAGNLASISLTAGDWDVNAVFAFLSSSAVVSYLAGSFSTTSATLDTSPDRYSQQLFSGFDFGSQNCMVCLGPTRISVASTTTIYGVARAGFSSGSLGLYGNIGARRVR